MFRIRLKVLREEAGYSQYSFAAAFGCAQSTVGSWEAGRREPSIDTILKLADFFHVTTDYLLGRTDERKVYITENPPELADIDVTEVGQSSPFTDEQLVALKEMFADMQNGK